MVMREALEEEIVKVEARIEEKEKPLPFDYCRLGAIQRKVTTLRMWENMCSHAGTPTGPPAPPGPPGTDHF